MQTQTETNTDRLTFPGPKVANTRTRGRKSQTTGQEDAIQLKPIKDSIDDLVAVYLQAQESAARCSDAIKAAAEESGLLANVLRRFVKARASEKFEQAQREVEQLAMVFEEIGDA